MNRAIFLDRDGVINVEVNYLGDPEKTILLPGAAEAIGKFHRAGFLAVVVTNQSGVARGMFTIKDVQAVHARLQRLLLAADPDGAADAYYCCCHHEKITGPCNCRKPGPGLLLAAAAALNIDLGASWMAGDKLSDLQAGQAAGCAGSFLVRGRPEEEAKAAAAGFRTAADLLELAEGLLRP